MATVICLHAGVNVVPDALRTPGNGVTPVQQALKLQRTTPALSNPIRAFSQVLSQ